MSEPSGLGRQRIQFAVFFFIVAVVGALFFYQPWQSNNNEPSSNSTTENQSQSTENTAVETSTTNSIEPEVELIVAPATLGSPDAPVLIEEYSDFQCLICRRYVTTLKDQVSENFVDTGMVYVKFHHYIKYGEESILASQASECANEQGKFWQYHRTLYDNQKGVNRGSFTNETLLQFAEQLEMDTDAFQTCLSSGKYREKIEQDTADAKVRGVNNTPTFVVNGQVMGNISSVDLFRGIIEKAMEN